MSDGNVPCATLTICNENVTGFSVDANEASETLGGIGSFGSGSSLIHGVNDGTIMIESSTINEFSFVIEICNCCGLGWIQYIILCMLPMWVTKKIMLLCMTGNVLRSILEEPVERFPCRDTGGPEYFQIESRTKILLMAASQWASVGSDTFKGVSLQ